MDATAGSKRTASISSSSRDRLPPDTSRSGMHPDHQQHQWQHSQLVSQQQQGSLDQDAFRSMMEEMGSRNLDSIRFPGYRAACKWRFIQKKTNMQQVDIYNVIEAIRENGLHAVSTALPDGIRIPVITGIKLNTLITSIYYQLSKRLPPSQKINYEESCRLLHAFLLVTFRVSSSSSSSDEMNGDNDNTGSGILVPVSSVKIALTILSSGKIDDKLTYIFSLISDMSTGSLVEHKFRSFIRDIMSLAYAASDFRDPCFRYEEDSVNRLIFFDHEIKLKEFIEIVINSKSPALCFSLFMAFARMPDVDQVVHAVTCESCRRTNFTGFRYKCQKCFNFNLCQECFWRGRTSDRSSHDPDSHPCREYSFWQSQSASIRRSFRCLPSHKAPKIVIRDEMMITSSSDPDKKIDLKHIVPASPVSAARHHHMSNNRIAPMSPFTRGSAAYGSMPNMGHGSRGSPIRSHVLPPASSPSPRLLSSRNDGRHASDETSSTGSKSVAPSAKSSATTGRICDEEEHDLVARYARKISSSTAAGICCTPLINRKAFLNAAAVSKSSQEMSEKKKLIADLEQRNRSVMREIEKLKNGHVSPVTGGAIGESNNGNIRNPASGGENGEEEELYATELTALRSRKEELEKHLTALQDSRKDLLIQLESLMKLLKNHGNLLSGPSSAASSLSRSQQSMIQRNGISNSDSFRIRSPGDAAPGPQSGSERRLHPGNESAKSQSAVRNAMSSLVQELNSEDEAAIDELGLKLSKKLRVQSVVPSQQPPPPSSSSPSANNSRLPATVQSRLPPSKLPVPAAAACKTKIPVNTSSPSANHRKHSNVDDDFDEDELALSLLRNQMMAMRKSQSEGLDSNSRMSQSAYSRDSFQSDDDTDIYPETDDEFYTSKWINQDHVRNGRR